VELASKELNYLDNLRTMSTKLRHALIRGLLPTYGCPLIIGCPILFTSIVSPSVAHAFPTPTTEELNTAGVLIAPFEGLVTTELGGKTEFDISLTSAPTSNVDVPLVSNDLTEGTLSLAVVSFTPQDWNITQTVTIFAVDDKIKDGNQSYLISVGPLAGADPAYSGLDPDDILVLSLDSESGVSCRSRDATIIGTEGDDAIIGTAGADVIVGLGGNDTIRGGGGNDIICGGAGRDRIYGNTGLDALSGEDGDDYLVGGKENDFLSGGAGNDFLKGGISRGDNCEGGSGKDRARLCEFRREIEVRK
jgi:Ca2+-binding RTX toxin-like protein